MHALGREARDRALDDDALAVRRDAAHLLGRRVVAGDQRDRHVVVARDERVDAGFADDVPVQLRVVDDGRVVGVREHGRRRRDRAVVADEEGRVERAVEALHHVQRLVLARDQRGAPVQPLGPQVLHQVVRVVDEERRRAGIAGAVDRGVDLVLEQRPAALVLRAVEHLLPVHDARRALDVGRDEDSHGTSPSRDRSRRSDRRRRARRGARAAGRARGRSPRRAGSAG